MAERGIRPPIQLYPYSGLANSALASMGSARLERNAAAQHQMDAKDELEECNRKKGLTEDQGRAELLQKKAEPERHLRFIDSISGFRDTRAQDADAAVAGAKARKELAEITGELFDLNSKKGHREIPQVDSLVKVGVFLGQRQDPLIDISKQQLRVSQELLNMVKRGRSASGLSEFSR